MTIKKFIPPIFLDVFRKLTTTNSDNKSGMYQIGNYQIETPPNFALPVYQKTHKLYDRFLPVLAKHINHNKLIIDIGANIGDTTIAMLQQCNNNIICIEPSDLFFPYLERNLKKLKPKDFNRVKIIKQLVGTGVLSGELDHTFVGTATLKVNGNQKSHTHIPLDQLIEDHSGVVLIKVDTDGFDFDVIKSAEKILLDSEPILYWENLILENFQKDGYEELYASLTQKGYKYIYIFDNFGNLITEEFNFETLKNINSYLDSMVKHGQTKSMDYTDILAATEKNSLTVRNVISEYKKEWINK